MRIARLGLLLVLGGALGILGAAACSSSTPSSVAPVDSGAPRGALGQACDPSAAHPCETLTDVCSVAVCDPTTLVCTRVTVDAGPTCSGGDAPPACASGACDGGGDASSPEGDAADDGAVDGSADGASLDATTDAGPGDASATDAATPTDGAADAGAD